MLKVSRSEEMIGGANSASFCFEVQAERDRFFEALQVRAQAQARPLAAHATT
eukprot:COSAG01_NODE_3158_length_6489_cov_2.264945_6_plen_52_part_00